LLLKSNTIHARLSLILSLFIQRIDSIRAIEIDLLVIVVVGNAVVGGFAAGNTQTEVLKLSTRAELLLEDSVL